MADTTNLEDLPTNPSTTNNNNVVLQKTEKQVTYAADAKMEDGGQPIPPTNMPFKETQKHINKVVTDIQQASAAGMTALPSRDIPIETSAIVQDEQTKPNFVPAPATDYIGDHENTHDMLKESVKENNRKDSLEVLYEELQIPVLLGVVYFLFQLPIVRKTLFKHIPSLFNKDGNPNLTGYVINSVFFALLYYILSKVMTHFAIIN